MLLFRYLDTNGDGTGTKNAAVDGSITPQVFKIRPPAGQHFKLARMLVYIEDVGAPDAGKYGNNLTLGTGIQIRVHNAADDSVISDLLDGVNIKTNSNWRRQCYDAGPDTYGQGNDSIAVRWTFTKAGDFLILTNHEYLAVTINDDLSGLVEHYFQVQGMF